MPAFHEIMGHAGAIGILQTMLRTGLTPPAMLLMGDAGIGKRMAADAFSRALLCQNKVRTSPFIEPCMSCLACRKMESRNHPDFSLVEPEGHFIKIDQIRQIQKQIVFGPLDGQKKLVLMDDADKMNAAAANSLLKTLEEPPPYALLMLIAARPSSLPETILSRCQKVAFHPPAYSMIETVLMEKRGWTTEEARLVVSLAGGQIGAALALDVDVARQNEADLHDLIAEETLQAYDRLLEVAKRHAEGDAAMDARCSYLAGWFRDVLVVQATTAEISPSWLVYPWRLSACIAQAGLWQGEQKINPVCVKEWAEAGKESPL